MAITGQDLVSQSQMAYLKSQYLPKKSQVDMVKNNPLPWTKTDELQAHKNFELLIRRFTRTVSLSADHTKFYERLRSLLVDQLKPLPNVYDCRVEMLKAITCFAEAAAFSPSTKSSRKRYRDAVKWCERQIDQLEKIGKDPLFDILVWEEPSTELETRIWRLKASRDVVQHMIKVRSTLSHDAIFFFKTGLRQLLGEFYQYRREFVGHKINVFEPSSLKYQKTIGLEYAFSPPKLVVNVLCMIGLHMEERAILFHEGKLKKSLKLRNRRSLFRGK